MNTTEHYTHVTCVRNPCSTFTEIHCSFTLVTAWLQEKVAAAQEALDLAVAVNFGVRETAAYAVTRAQLLMAMGMPGIKRQLQTPLRCRFVKSASGLSVLSIDYSSCFCAPRHILLHKFT